MKKLACLIGMMISSLFLPQAAWAETLTPDSIVALSSSGLGDEAIIAKIKAEGTVFELSTDAMLALRQKGVSSPVIAAMLSNKPAEQPISMDSPDPAVRHPSGVYLLSGEGPSAKMQRIDPTASNQAKTGGILGYAFTGGLASASIKVVIQQPSAKISSSTSPRFYFFFDEATNANNSSAWASGMNTMVSSPSEFSLIRLSVKSDHREARVGSMNIAGAKTGVMDKDRISFENHLVRPGVYQVDISQPLQPGEYGFIFSIAGSGASGAMTARIFDFGVK